MKTIHSPVMIITTILLSLLTSCNGNNQKNNKNSKSTSPIVASIETDHFCERAKEEDDKASCFNIAKNLEGKKWSSEDPIYLPIEKDGVFIETQVLDKEIKNILMKGQLSDYTKENINKSASLVVLETVRLGLRTTFEFLIHQGANPKADDEIAMAYAAHRGDIEMIEILEKLGLDIHAQSDMAILYAGAARKNETVEYLEGRGLDIRSNEDHAILLAIYLGDLESIKYLETKGLNVLTQKDDFMLEAASLGHLEIVKYFVSKGVLINESWVDYASEKARKNGRGEIETYLKANAVKVVEATDNSEDQNGINDGEEDTEGDETLATSEKTPYCHNAFQTEINYFYEKSYHSSVRSALYFKVIDAFPKRLTKENEESCYAFILENGLALLSEKYHSLPSAYKNYAELFNIDQKMADSYSEEIEKLEFIFPEATGDSYALLKKYQEMVLKVRTNISPKLTRFLSEINKNIRLYLDKNVLESTPTLKSSEDFLKDILLKKSLLKDENFKGFLQDIVKFNEKTNILDLEGLYNDELEGKENLNQFLKNDQKLLTLLNPRFVRYFTLMKRSEFNSKADDSFDYKSVSLSNSNPNSTISSPDTARSRRIIRSGDKVMVCQAKDCRPAKHLFDKYFSFDDGDRYVVIEKENLKFVSMKKTFLDQVNNEAKCFGQKIDKSVSTLEYGASAGKALLGTVSIFATAIGDTFVGTFQTITNWEDKFDYKTARFAYQKTEEGIRKTLDQPITRRMAENERLKNVKKTYNTLSDEEQKTIAEKLINKFYSTKAKTISSCEEVKKTNLDVEKEVYNNF
jgi:hypothetical protein